MHYPNPREHPLFDWYHQIRIAEIALLALAAVSAWRLRHHIGDITGMIWLAGLSVAAWELFEVSYLLGRIGQAAWHENILGFWSVDGSGVIVIHVARAIIGAALIWKGSAR